MMAKPVSEHAWLQRLVGEWSYEHEASMAPGEPVQTFRGVEVVRSIGGLWVVAEAHGPMPDGDEAHMILTLGFDTAKGRFVGTWLGSMMTTLWVYDGALNGDTLTLECEGPSMTVEGAKANYRETVTLVSNDHRTFSSSVQSDDGSWHTFMTATYRRTK